MVKQLVGPLMILHSVCCIDQPATAMFAIKDVGTELVLLRGLRIAPLAADITAP